jgi:molybdopterin molybdotransferase
MHTPAEALDRILERIRPLQETERVPLEEASGRVLAAEAVADHDLPPFEKSAMDGFALRHADLAADAPALPCAGESRAGEPLGRPLPAGACVEIYTGAELPEGADTVVMVEETERDGDTVRFTGEVKHAQHVQHTGEILATGRTALAAPRRLTPADLSVLAAVGVDPVPVVRRPRVAVLTTGDELVAPSERPGAGQIREGNTYTLRAAVARAGAELLPSGRVPDERAALRGAFGAALESGDALVTSGGVSVGKYDLVGEVLEELGVEPVLHKVAIKPGKPIWFGLKGERPVFGLPGNPVSSLLGAAAFVAPALARLGGAPESDWAGELPHARWAGDARRAGWRQENLPCELVHGDDGLPELVPVRWLGSADMVGAARADVFAVLPPESEVRPGELLAYRRLP